MSYDAAIESLFALAGELHSVPGQPRRKFELAHMRILAAALGDPQNKFPSVLIAGTNGKGSTSATLASILTAAGYKVGLYTSPHLVRVNERIRVAGADISDDDFARLYFFVDDTARKLVDQEALPNPPSFFETMTAVAFAAFAEAQVDIAILEVGMGGRLDATNIVEPVLSVITDISLDHTEWLGDTIALISREKAGILRKNGVFVTLSQHPEANYTLGEVAVALNARGINAADYLPARTTESSTRNQYSLQVIGQQIIVDSPLTGQHQQRNIALAIAAAVELAHTQYLKDRDHLKNGHPERTLNEVKGQSKDPQVEAERRERPSLREAHPITPSAIEAGIRNTRWPGRLEAVSKNGVEFLLDVGHNPAGAWAVRAALSHKQNNPKTLIFGVLRDKALREIAQILFPLFDKILLTPIHSPRSASIEDLKAAAEATGATFEIAANPREALEKAQLSTPPGGLVVGTGSVYLVGELREELVP